MREKQAPLPERYLNRASRQTGLPRRVLVMAALAVALIVVLAFTVFQTAPPVHAGRAAVELPRSR